MSEFYIKYFEDGVLVSSYHCADELEGIEKFIELFKVSGGQVPKPEPVESEWEKLKRELKGSRAKVFTYDVVKVMDELDRRCPGGGGKNAGA